MNDPQKQTPYMALGFWFPVFQQTHPLLSTMSAAKVKRTQIARTTSSWHDLYIRLQSHTIMVVGEHGMHTFEVVVVVLLLLMLSFDVF